MAGDPNIRASDEDRDRVATLLREHHAAGRLTPEEFNERLDQAFAAKTLGDLDALLADLPAIDLYRLPDAALRKRAPLPGASSHREALAVARQHGRLSPAWQAAWGSWVSATAVLTVIWVLSGMNNNLWFLWIAAPWGALLLARWLTGAHPDSGGAAQRQQLRQDRDQWRLERHEQHQQWHDERRQARDERRGRLPGDRD
jgi:Domain of unknown function (DUF1707)